MEEILKSLIKLSGPYLTYAIGGAITFGFFFEAFRMWKKTEKIKRDAKKAVDTLNEVINDPDIKSENGDINKHDIVRKKFYEKYDKVDEELSNIRTYKHEWNEFKEHLLFPNEEDDEALIKNTILPDVFFSTDSIVYENINQKHYDAVPGYLTGLGVFGTFLGFIAGLITLDLGQMDADNMAKFKVGIQGLLSGASTAFITSLLGIGSAILFSIIEKWRVRKLDNLADAFVDKLEECLKLTTQEQQQQQIVSILSDVRRNSDEFVNSFISRLEESFRGLLESHVVENVNQGSSNIVNALSSIREIQENGQKDLLKNISEQLSGGLQSTASEAQKNAMDSFGTLQNTFQTSIERMIELQQNNEISNRKFLEEISTSTNGVVDNLKHSVKELMSNFEEQSQNGNKRMDEQLNQLMEKFGAATTNGAQNIEAKLNQSAENISTAFDQVSTRFIDANLNLAEKVENGGKKYIDGASQISTSSEVFRNVVGELKDNLQSMKDITNSQVGIASNNRSSLEGFTKNLQAMDDLGGKIRLQNEELTKLTQGLSEEREVLKNSTEKLTAQWENYSVRFKDIDVSLENAFNKILEGNDKYISGYEDLRDKTIKAVGQISTTLSSAIEELEEALSINRKD